MMGLFEDLLEHIEFGETVVQDAYRLRPVLQAVMDLLEAEWGDGAAWRALARLRQAVELWKEAGDDKAH